MRLGLIAYSLPTFFSANGLTNKKRIMASLKMYRKVHFERLEMGSKERRCEIRLQTLQIHINLWSQVQQRDREAVLKVVFTLAGQSEAVDKILLACLGFLRETLAENI